VTVDEIAILGVGMHPWGKWGRNFVEYGVHAARDALDDAGVDWNDVQFVSGANTVRNGYPGYVSGSTFAKALGFTGLPARVELRRLRVGGHRALHRPGADPGRGLRRGARRRRRHHPEGLLRARRRRPSRRPRLAAVPARRHATNPVYFALYARRRMDLFGDTPRATSPWSR
jgi:hypothetical protein